MPTVFCTSLNTLKRTIDILKNIVPIIKINIPETKLINKFLIIDYFIAIIAFNLAIHVSVSFITELCEKESDFIGGPL